MTIARVRSATSSITNKVLEIGIKIMRILREKRLNQELMNGVTLTQLRNKLRNEIDFLEDNDRLCQAIDANKDLSIVNEWIEIEFGVFLNAHELSEDELKDKEYVQSLYENYLENTLQTN